MKQIIAVDDDPDTLDALNVLLDPAEYNICLYSNGNDILENNAGIPDLYILDKQLSGVDGIDICRFLKSLSATAHIPVIILSASPNIQIMAKEAGANGYLEKPFSVKALREMIRQLLNQ